MVAYAFGLAASSFFPVIIAGIFWKRATKEGAIAGDDRGHPLHRRLHRVLQAPPARTSTAPRTGSSAISPEGIGAVGMLVAFAVLVGVSLATQAPPREVQDLVASLRYPREAAPRRRRRRAPDVR